MTIPMVIALDVGGTSMKGAVLDADLWSAAELREPTGREDGPDAVVARVLDALESLRRMAGSRAVAAGLVVPGIVDTPSGTAVWSENIGWRDIPLRALAEERLGMPVAFGHDVRAGGLAELRVGAARDADNAVFLPIGTGIAAAMVVDGRVLDAGGYAGEVGHVDVGHGEPCACGGRGCLEAISSAAAIGRRYATVVSGDGTATAQDVIAMAQAGDSAASAVWAEALDGLARGLAVLASLLAPEVVVIGGGLASASDLASGLSDRLDGMLTFQRRPRLVASPLGDQAGCLGAGLLARDLVAP